ncbi:siderophore-interacting protein [Martelella soudanensis]|uniref:siderophore-interacting protein n=1 Tax=unclassified Martelella TaxID=2629616 RepID=UPI0015DED610|nr:MULTISPECIES: siderophore-interacting protein [unclassified Martelella]
MTENFRLSGIAMPQDAAGMLDIAAEHFAEHAAVARTGDRVTITSEVGEAELALDGSLLRIDLAAQSTVKLQLARTMLAEHLFYFAGDAPFELTWSDPPPPAVLANLHEVRVVSAEPVTPHMLRVKFACADVTPFVGGQMHVRLLVPPKGRPPVWPVIDDDGRIKWPEGEDALLVRVYTIRFVDTGRNEVWVDFLQHPNPDTATPGADFARDARPGDRAAFLGPGGGGVPEAGHIFLAGDEAALPAIARIAEEAPAGTRLTAIIEVENKDEEQPIESAASLDLNWIHRAEHAATGGLLPAIKDKIASLPPETFMWIACERGDIRDIRALLKDRQHDRKRMYVAWYWERGGESG